MQQSTPYDHQLMMAMYFSGIKIAVIAEKFDTPVRTVENRISYYLRKHGLKSRKDRADIEAYKDVIIELYMDSMSIRELAGKFDCSHSYMRKKLTDWGVKGRNGGIDAAPRLGLAEFYQGGWTGISEPTVVMVRKRPRFVVIPLEQYDD